MDRIAASAGLRVQRSGLVKIYPRFGRIRLFGAYGVDCSPVLENRKAKLSCLLLGEQAPVRQARLPNRGVRERPYDRCRLPRGFAGARNSVYCECSRNIVRHKLTLVSSVCRQRGCALGSRDCLPVGLLSTQIVGIQAKAIVIDKNEAHCMQRRHQRFPTVRTVGEAVNGEVKANTHNICACTSTVF